VRKLFQKLGLINAQAQSSGNTDVELDVSLRNTSNSNGQNPSPKQNVVKQNFTELDEEFAYNFTNEGGRFMFCLSKKSLYESINYVLEINNWKNVFMTEDGINDLMSQNNQINTIENHINSDVFISSCDNLVSFNGRIMVSSNQCKGLNFSELPVNHIIIANHSQIVKNLGEGLRRINSIYFKNLPSKITTIKNKKSNKNSGTAKNIYVFLLEDY